MASIFGHGVLGFTLTKIIGKQNLKWLMFVAVFSTILLEFDIVAFKFGMPNEHPLGHRGFSYSILFRFNLGSSFDVHTWSKT